MSELSEQTEPALERFVFFSDAVFAIAITVLVLELKVPTLPADADEAAWVAALMDLAPSFFAFGLSFFVIGSIWSAHHSVFRLVARFDQRMMQPNFVLLFAVVMAPFSTALLGRTSHAPAPYIFYSATLVVAGISKAWLTRIALRPGLVRAGTAETTLSAARRRSWLLPAAAALSVALAFVTPGWNNLAMLLMLVGRLPPFRVRH